MGVENLYTKDCIRTVSGIYVNVFEPTEDMIDIKDIAHALSMQVRFGGHLPTAYTVAQHSVMCARGVHGEHKLTALLHDASEAYLLDIPSPIKSRLSYYKEIEDGLMKLISTKFNCIYPLPDEVKNVDKKMLEWEWNTIMLQQNHSPSLDTWSRNKAYKCFLADFKDYTHKTQQQSPL